MDRAQAVQTYLAESGRFPDLPEVSFLAAGEYNENYLVQAGGDRFVFRINHGSQLGLANQIEYEFKVLTAVAASGVTPRPVFCDPAPPSFPGGVLLMTFLPGRPLDYRTDLEKAALVFARIHALPPSEGLIAQARPMDAIAQESLGLIERHPDHPLGDVRRRLEAYHAEIVELSAGSQHFFESEPLVIANTEVNSGNFLVDGDRAGLVDWEKAVVSYRYQDLGHFLAPTTTLWKTDILLGQEEKNGFLAAYRREMTTLVPGFDLSPDEIEAKTDLLIRTILLRGLAWCYLAWYEYTQTDRPLKNPDTFRKIEQYLGNIECFLQSKI